MLYACLFFLSSLAITVLACWRWSHHAARADRLERMLLSAGGTLRRLYQERESLLSELATITDERDTLAQERGNHD